MVEHVRFILTLIHSTAGRQPVHCHLLIFGYLLKNFMSTNEFLRYVRLFWKVDISIPLFYIEGWYFKHLTSLTVVRLIPETHLSFSCLGRWARDEVLMQNSERFCPFASLKGIQVWAAVKSHPGTTLLFLILETIFKSGPKSRNLPQNPRSNNKGDAQRNLTLDSPAHLVTSCNFRFRLSNQCFFSHYFGINIDKTLSNFQVWRFKKLKCSWFVNY